MGAVHAALRPGVRDALAKALQAEGIPTAVYYRIAMHRQPAYAQYPPLPRACPLRRALCAEVISLPMHAYLDEATQDKIIAAVRRAVGK